jgi:hypothetical protein
MKALLVATTVTVVLAIASFLTLEYYLQRKAQSVIDDVSSVIAAPDHDVAFAALKEKYGESLLLVGCWSPRTGYEVCSYDVTVSNRPISKVFRIPFTELNARFDLLNRSISAAVVEYRSAQWKGESPVVHVQTDFCPAISTCGSVDFFYVNPWSLSSAPERWNGIVEMGVSTTPELQRAALSFNSKCLTSVRGCTDIAQLLPSVWSGSPNGVRCVIKNHQGKAR